MKGGLVIIKVGGDVVRGSGADVIAGGILELMAAGKRVLVIHGGGPQATELQKALGQEPNVVAGRRITDADALRVMKMAVGGAVNIDLCSALIRAGAKPVGLHGASSHAVRAVKRPPRVVAGGGDEPIDFGHVGDVVGVNKELLDLLLDNGFVPVIACLGADDAGDVFNINADIVANQTAQTLQAEHLVLCTSTPGVLGDVNDPSTRMATLTPDGARAAIDDGTIQGGMIPKIMESLRVLESGVGSIHIVGQLSPGELKKAVSEPGAVGTTIVLG